MRVFSRALAYSLSLCALLVYLSYRIHSAPSQVELRLERSLGRIVRAEARVEGCEQPALGLITARSIVLPAAPPIDERTLLVLEEVRVNDVSSRRSLRRAGPSDTTVAAPISIHAREGKLYLDHAVHGPPGEETGRWNFDELFRPDDLLSTLSEVRAEMLLERLSVYLQDLRSPRSKLQWRIEIRDLEGRRATPAGLVLEADLPEGKWWSQGHVVATWLPGGVIALRGDLEDLRAPGEWLPLLPGRHRALWELFQPTGSWNVDVDDLRIGREGLIALRGTVRHYDTSLRLGKLGAELNHLSGFLRMTEDGAKLGPADDGEPARAEVAGLPIEVAASLDSRGAEVRLTLPSLPLERLFLSPGEPKPAARSFAALISKARPLGTLQGEAIATLEPEGRQGFRGELAIEGLRLAGLPCLADGSGKVFFEGGDAGVGKGKVLLGGIACHGLGILRGEVPFTWDPAGARFTLYDLKWDGPEDPAGAKPARLTSGSLFGTVGWNWETGLDEADLRWMGGSITTKLFRAAGVSGKLHRGPAGQPAIGVLEWGTGVVPAGVLWPGAEELAFDSGKSLIRIEDGVLRVSSFRLTGRQHGLRAAGTLQRSGEVDLVVLLATGSNLSAFHDLGDESAAHEWKEAARDGYRAFRITGGVSSPGSREIGGLDPAFVGGDDGR